MTVFNRDAFQSAFPVSRETLSRLELLVSELIRWSSALNLVARPTLSDVWSRHILDSAQLLSMAPETARSWVDLGSGAGFPGLVIAALAMERHPNLAVTLIESDARKCAFLGAASRAMGVAAIVESRRIETPPPQQYDVISARALAPLPRLLDLALPYMRRDSVALFPKGARYGDELTAAAKHWHMETLRAPSLTDPNGVVLHMTGVRRATPGP